MVKFIKLTRDFPVWYNVALIDSFGADQGSEGAYITLSGLNDVTLKVRETPEQILALIAGKKP